MFNRVKLLSKSSCSVKQGRTQTFTALKEEPLAYPVIIFAEGI